MFEKSRYIIVFFFLIAICLCFYSVEAGLQEPPPEQVVSFVDDTNSTHEAPASHSQDTNIVSSDTPLERVETEIAAFILQGKRRRHKLEIFDLDVLITVEGLRFFPLFRLLDALKLEKSEDNHCIVFQPEGSPEVTINTQTKEIQTVGAVETVDLIMAVSDISMNRDIFLPPEVISEIFSMELEWDDEAYAFIASTEKLLSIWKRPKGKSLLGIETEELVEKLPKAHGPAPPSRRKLSLDFMELQARIRFKAVNPDTPKELKFSSLEQTLWGAFANGRYKIKITELDQTYYDSELESRDGPALMVDWGEWRYAGENIETVAGDSNFGLNDLIFPTVGMAGLRINGLYGFSKTAQANGKSRMGLSRRFEAPLRFEGYAPVGSHVELFVNDRLVDTDDVITSLPSVPGTGKYSFEEVSLAPGSLNDIRIEITDPDGVLTVIEKSILGTSTLLPKGGLAYFTGVGTNRDTDEWEARGTFAGARSFYGISDRLTIGMTTAFQEDFHEPVESMPDPKDRQYPDSSLHVGAQLAWKPSDSSIILGDFAWVKGSEGKIEDGDQSKDEDRFDDLSLKLDGRFYPAGKIELHGLCFRHGLDFFDGVNRNLRDKQGYVLNAKWPAFSNWSFHAAGGKVRDNVEDNRDDTLSVSFQNAKISTSIIPRTKFSVSCDRFSPSWNEDEKSILFFEFRSNPFSGISISGSYATGDDLGFDENDDFLDGLRLPGISRHRSRTTSAFIKKNLPWGGSLGLSYRESESTEEALIIHTGRSKKWIPIEFRTEIGYNIYQDTICFENRTEIPLSRSRKTRAGILAEYDKREWKVEFYLNITELFSFIGNGFRYISGYRLNPDDGAICGKVFLDRNANAILDPGERGISDVEVLLNNRRSVNTDENGYFIHKLPGNSRQAQMNVHPDTIPAIYSCTHCRQKADLRKGEITRTNFGVTPVNVITGYVLSKDIENKLKPVGGVRIYVSPTDTDEQIAESITANDGSYYLEDIRPGEYTIQMDTETVPPQFVIKFESRMISIAPDDEPQELQLSDFICLPNPLEAL